MTKIRMRKNVAGPTLARAGHFEGDIVSVGEGADVDLATATEWVRRGFAEVVKEPALANVVLPAGTSS
jgi:hypothetical protein